MQLKVACNNAQPQHIPVSKDVGHPVECTFPYEKYRGMLCFILQQMPTSQLPNGLGF